VTRSLLSSDLKVDGLVFPAGTPMQSTYNFPFYRVSWLYDFNVDPDNELAIGLSLQIRNATIEFESLDGTVFSSGFWLGSEADGFYAPISYINGSDNEVIGAILDASVRAGRILPKNVELFLNLRYLGGGAVGKSEPDSPGDGYVRNWLHFFTVTIGFSLGLF
jgi:hypothetical protein